ncbi:kinase-like domain-containing protein [Syncephalis plumigaleata]|nr:kinase-like domain-containing protein [Syncephalis plumigaleata]
MTWLWSTSSAVAGVDLPEYAPNGLPLKDSGMYGVYNQNGLTISDWLYHTADTSVGFAIYKNTAGLLKCTKDRQAIRRELSILAKVEAAPTSSNSLLMHGITRVARHMHTFFVNDLTCIITSHLSKIRFSQYTAKLDDEEKQELMPILYRQLIQAVAYLHHTGITHNSINPMNIMVKEEVIGQPELMLINYTNAVFIRTFEQRTRSIQVQVPTYLNFGYDSPESSVYNAVNLLKHDAWAIGMTIYVGFIGLPVYGFTQHGRRIKTLSNIEYRNLLGNVYRKYQSNDEPIKLDVAAQLYFRSLEPEAIRLLTVNPTYRPTPLDILLPPPPYKGPHEPLVTPIQNH